MYPRTFVHIRGTRIRVMTPAQESSLGPGWFAEDQQAPQPEPSVLVTETAPEPAPRKRGRPRKH